MSISINEVCIAGKMVVATSKMPIASLRIPSILDVFILADIPLTFERVEIIVRRMMYPKNIYPKLKLGISIFFIKKGVPGVK